MKLRQAKKICNRISTRNLVYKNEDEAIIVTGVKDTAYTYEQFNVAARRIDKAFKRQYK